MSKKTDKNKNTETEKLGRLLLSIAELGYADKKKLYRISFVKGLFSGLGGVIGATIVVAILLAVLSLLGEVPFVGKIAETVEKTINNR